MRHFYLILFAAISSNVFALTVTNIAADYHDGQVFITWNNITNVNSGFYHVYKSNAPITQNNFSSATYLGRVLWNFAIDARFDAATGSVVPELLITNDNPRVEVPAFKNLFVTNCIGEGIHTYYGVIYEDAFSNVIIAPGNNATTASVVEHLEPVRAYLQENNYPVFGSPGDAMDIYIHYVSNVDVVGYPAMTNEGCFVYHFGLVKKNTPGLHPLIISFHGGGGSFFNGNLGSSVSHRCWILFPDDWIPFSPDGNPNGNNTYWLGYHEDFDIYATTALPFPTSGVVKAYTLTRVMWTMNWVTNRFNSKLDQTQYSLNGSSAGASGALLLSLLYPDMFAAVMSMVPKVDLNTSDDDNPYCQFNSGGDSRMMIRMYYGNETTSNLQTDVANFSQTGTNFKIYDILDLTKLLSLNKYRSLPYMTVFAGKNDIVTCWDEKIPFFKATQTCHHGGLMFWDLRDHTGNDAIWPRLDTLFLSRFTNQSSYPAFSKCTLDGAPGDISNPAQPYYDGDDFGGYNINLDWNPNSLIDSSDVWQAEIYMKQILTTGNQLFPSLLPSFTRTDVTLRRTKNFKDFPASTPLCWEVLRNNQSVQSGVVYASYTTDGIPIPVTISKVKIFDSGSTLRIYNCLGPQRLSMNEPEQPIITPDPFVNQFTLTLEVNESFPIEIIITNVLGQALKVLTFNTNEGINNLTIDGSDLAPGIYFLIIKHGGEKTIQKIVKE